MARAVFPEIVPAPMALPRQAMETSASASPAKKAVKAASPTGTPSLPRIPCRRSNPCETRSAIVL